MIILLLVVFGFIVKILLLVLQAKKEMGDNTERSFIMVKPDGVHRGVVGEIVKRFEQRGYRLVAMKFVWVREGSVVGC